MRSLCTLGDVEDRSKGIIAFLISCSYSNLILTPMQGALRPRDGQDCTHGNDSVLQRTMGSVPGPVGVKGMPLLLSSPVRQMYSFAPKLNCASKVCSSTVGIHADGAADLACMLL